MNEHFRADKVMQTSDYKTKYVIMEHGPPRNGHFFLPAKFVSSQCRSG